MTSPHELDTGEFERRFELSLTMVGRVAAAPAGEVTIDGARVAGVHGWDHFSA